MNIIPLDEAADFPNLTMSMLAELEKMMNLSLDISTKISKPPGMTHENYVRLSILKMAIQMVNENLKVAAGAAAGVVSMEEMYGSNQ